MYLKIALVDLCSHNMYLITIDMVIISKRITSIFYFDLSLIKTLTSD